ncbi:putative universal stress protein UspA-like nucleotide-binding protein [Magnetospirillum sp. LM-5]|uniref:universal stress protein n=1 Tax=Magnetospirillum sp. LM-5 TaxID=2681466 RepID=UPI001380D677|nr:universal stress protein [Magnetospirillum sp. LM-5]CAA7625353.1 putative universal stress protein UspA-like nucleotide-binding protein [Magnetospirillum sp. LM-5]
MKDILVHLDGGERDRILIEVARGLAKRHGARLTALFARNDPQRTSAMARQASDHLRLAQETGAKLFAQLTEGAGVETRWWQLPHGEAGMVEGETVFCARYFDLVVMGQYHSQSSNVGDDLVEQVILNGGRPVLVIPYAGAIASVAERCVVAWNAGREATRAIHDSLTLLQAAKSVTVLSMRPKSADAAIDALSAMPATDIVDHLKANGINADGEHLPDENIGKMDMLLSRACDLGADLMVMGAHGQYGLSRLRGSGTRYVLKHMTLPVLMGN